MKPDNRNSLRIILILFLSVVIFPAYANELDNSFSANREENGINNMSTSAGECKIDRIKLSQKMINFIFDDINATYKQSGGGGISEIKEMQTNIYIVSIPQEERIDRIKYHLSVDEKCEISIVKKEQSTINFGQ